MVKPNASAILEAVSRDALAPFSEKNRWIVGKEIPVNLPVTGPSECLITHVMAAGAPLEKHRVAPDIFHKDWPDAHTSGPLFWQHYSAMGLDPRGLKQKGDSIDQWERSRRHVMDDWNHCKDRHGEDCWGITSSEGPPSKHHYQARFWKQDDGTVAPTGALSSIVYAFREAMAAARRFAGDKQLWGEYGFVDAFNLNPDGDGKPWYARDKEGRGVHLAIDQAPIVVMIENQRSGLLWDLLMSCPEIQQGLQRLDYESPHIKSERGNFANAVRNARQQAAIADSPP
jgi:hypothetical protein